MINLPLPSVLLLKIFQTIPDFLRNYIYSNQLHCQVDKYLQNRRNESLSQNMCLTTWDNLPDFDRMVYAQKYSELVKIPRILGGQLDLNLELVGVFLDIDGNWRRIMSDNTCICEKLGKRVQERCSDAFFGFPLSSKDLLGVINDKNLYYFILKQGNVKIFNPKLFISKTILENQTISHGLLIA